MKFLPNQFKSGRLVQIFFLALCVFSILMVGILSSKKAYNTRNLQEIVRLEIFDFEYYRIGMQGVSIVAFGKKGRENSQKINELEHFNVSNFIFSNEKLKKDKKGVNENLQSRFAFYDNQEILFPQGVNYQRDGTEFWSQKARYNPDKKELKGEGEFIILDENYKIRGQNISYVGNKVYAQNIYGILRIN